ncbi:hypothetical protein K470DRAFT_223735 [Piedraia hortae CBS 480.64]|uniref:Dipeptidase n=1 Tax=Piedraia hortae CBS 480.64 TaxID=1314780 RepID=A0A6A7BPQ5_9PEZI|nr:hypothetical protein K470DRAFT_223735 [Piedraia hortae CBS 480.64]
MTLFGLGVAALLYLSTNTLSLPSSIQIHPIMDGHDDFLFLLRNTMGNHIYNDNFTKPFLNGTLQGQFDLKRSFEGKMGGAFWSAWVPCPTDGRNFSDENYDLAVKTTLEQIDLFYRLQAEYPHAFTPPKNAIEAEKILRNYNSPKSRLVSPLAIEGLHQIGNSLSTLRLYYNLGVRYATLTWNCHNKYADAALEMPGGVMQKAIPLHNGLSPEGSLLVHEMNRMGMIVDLSHVSADTMRDVLAGNKTRGIERSIAPPIFSHSSAYAVCPHPRNVPDDVLQMVKERGSVVMINFLPEFVSCKEAKEGKGGLPTFANETNTIEKVVEHIMHIGGLVGFEFVGIGSDFDGIASTPRGLEDVGRFKDLLGLLRERGLSEREIGMVANGNVMRVWKEVERVAEEMKNEKPYEEELREILE